MSHKDPLIIWKRIRNIYRVSIRYSLDMLRYCHNIYEYTNNISENYWICEQKELKYTILAVTLPDFQKNNN